jgi:Tfp pilus assembly protein PilF
LNLRTINGKGETKAARDAFGEAMLREPDNAQLMNNYALTALQDGAVDTALDALRRAAEKNPLNRVISANRNFVAGMAGLAPEREKGESDADWSAKLLQYAQGAKSASRKLQATALFSRAILTLDRFDEAVWSEVEPVIGGATK